MKFNKKEEKIMQQHRTERTEKIMLGVKGFFWVAGLLIAGSDSNFMPWANGLGLLLFIASSILLVKQSSQSAAGTGASECPGVYRKVCEKKNHGFASHIIPVTGLLCRRVV